MHVDTWLTRLSAELGIADLDLDSDAVQTLLDLARDAAHEVERIAAPLSTFLVGVAVGRGQSLEAAAASATALALDLNRPDPNNDGDPDPAS
jgi:hypothetical protein